MNIKLSNAVTPQRILPWTGSFASHVPTSRLPSPWLQLPALGRTPACALECPFKIQEQQLKAWQHLVSTTCFGSPTPRVLSCIFMYFQSLRTPRVVDCASSEQPVDLVLTLLHPAWIGVRRLLPALTIVPAPRRRQSLHQLWSLTYTVLLATTTASIPSHIT